MITVAFSSSEQATRGVIPAAAAAAASSGACRSLVSASR